MLKPEQREWIVNKKDIVPVRTKEGRCLVCDKKLSVFNLGKYCFNHQYADVKDEDRRALDKDRKNSLIYRRKQKDARMAKARKAL